MSDIDPEIAGNYMAEMYGEIITDPRAIQCLRTILQLIAAEKEGGVYFHCYAGKDRTGIVLAILLTILGVDKEEIIRDYMRTAELRRTENERIFSEARRNGASEKELDVMRVFYTVQKDYLEYAFAAVEKHSGSFQRYLTEELALSDAIAGQIQARFLT